MLYVRDSAIVTIEHVYELIRRESDGLTSLTFCDIERSDRGHLMKNRVFCARQRYSLTFGDLERSDSWDFQLSLLSESDSTCCFLFFFFPNEGYAIFQHITHRRYWAIGTNFCNHAEGWILFRETLFGHTDQGFRRGGPQTWNFFWNFPHAIFRRNFIYRDFSRRNVCTVQTAKLIFDEWYLVRNRMTRATRY